MITLRKKPALFRPEVLVSDVNGRELGRLRSKMFTIGGGFHVFDPGGVHVAQVKGDDNIPLQDKFAKQDAIRTESKAKIKAELTSEQLAKWDELEKKGKKPKK